MKNTVKRIIAVLAAIIILTSSVLAFASCSEKTKYTVGICQYMQHSALDSATQGFKDALKAQLGDDVSFEESNASGDGTLCSTITDNFVSKGVDLILANATPALQSAVKSTKTIPVLGTSVTEYGVALGIENFSGTVGGNISGTSDLAPLDQQAQMVLDLVPNAKKVGILYCATEANSIYQVKVVKEYLESKNITVTSYPFADSSDVALITKQAADNNDALYIPTDNVAASCTNAIFNAMENNKKPIITGDEGTLKGCGIASLSISYYDLGYKTGLMAADILTGKADISKMAVEYTPADKLTKLYNKAICEALGIDTAALEEAGYTAVKIDN